MNSEEYKAKTDEEIIELIHKGEDKYAQEYMLVKYKPLVMACSKSCFISGAEKDDVIQEGMIGLYKAIRDFVAEKNVGFYPFAKMCIERQIATALKTANRQKHKPLNESYSLDKNIFEDDEEATYIEMLKSRTNESPENKRMLEENVMANLSAMEKKVLSLYLKGKKYAEIAIIVEKDEKSIDNALQRIKKKISKIVAERQ